MVFLPHPDFFKSDARTTQAHVSLSSSPQITIAGTRAVPTETFTRIRCYRIFDGPAELVRYNADGTFLRQTGPEQYDSGPWLYLGAGLTFVTGCYYAKATTGGTGKVTLTGLDNLPDPDLSRVANSGVPIAATYQAARAVLGDVFYVPGDGTAGSRYTLLLNYADNAFELGDVSGTPLTTFPSIPAGSVFRFACCYSAY